MANPIDTAERLRSLLEIVSSSVKMAEKPRKRITSAIKEVENIIESLRDIHKNVVPLNIDEGPDNLTQNLEFWNNLPAGLIKNTDPDFPKLIENSKTLKDLHGVGIDILNITKFSSRDLELAKKIGDNFNLCHEIWQKFKKVLLYKKGEDRQMKAIRKDVDAAETFFELIKEFKVIEKYDLSLYVKKQLVETNFSRIKKNTNEKKPFFVKFNFLESTYDELIKGNWFNAYAYSIINDHLIRNNLSFEIYTLVSYKSPPEIIKSAGDFDIIAMVGKKILLVESKSGELIERRGDFEKIIEKTEDLKKVFDLTKADFYEYIFLLIYNPYLNDEEIISKNLEDTGIRPIKPEQIRGEVYACFGDDKKN